MGWSILEQDVRREHISASAWCFSLGILCSLLGQVVPMETRDSILSPGVMLVIHSTIITCIRGEPLCSGWCGMWSSPQTNWRPSNLSSNGLFPTGREVRLLRVVGAGGGRSTFCSPVLRLSGKRWVLSPSTIKQLPISTVTVFQSPFLLCNLYRSGGASVKLL